MKQLAQRMKDGELRVVEVPTPELDPWKVLVRTSVSLVSAGTERAKIEIGRENLLGKARRRPDQVQQVLSKVRTDGLSATIEAVRSRLEALSPLGYCAAGLVETVGANVRDIMPGDFVACGGENAAHAEVLAVPGNLCVAVPRHVDPVAAAFATLGSIALHGFRRADLRLGERVAVVGMGLVGQLTARIARAAGCEVLGVDLERWRLEVAEQAGAVNLARLRNAMAASDTGSWDAVIVTAAATTNDPASLATDLARERGKIVIVGDVRLDLDRNRLYAKELDLRLARSYGPGRYDSEYEQRGLDYPVSYVRWTERRNMEAFLRLLAERNVTVDDLITHRFTVAEGREALDILTKPDERALGVVIEYPAREETPTKATVQQRARPVAHGAAVGFIGGGSFARRYLIPLAAKHGLVLDRVATASGLSAVSVAEQFDFQRGACTVFELLDDPSLAGVIIATRHDRHGDLALAALRAGKAVFVEKPLCLSSEELESLQQELDRGTGPLMVGFNRRFAPATLKIQSYLAGAQGPTNVLVRVNAAPLPIDHWLNVPHEGGGRLLGEGCHFIDLITQFIEADPVGVLTQGKPPSSQPLQSVQDFSVSIRFADGSLGTLLYGTAGNPGAGKELVEVHRGRLSARIDDFHALHVWGTGRRRKHRSHRQDKGHSEEIRHYSRVVRGEADPPPYRTYLTSSALTLAALRSLETGEEERILRA